MTPHEYIEHLEQLAASGRDHEILDFAHRFGAAVVPLLSTVELDLVGGIMESALMIVTAQDASVSERAPVRECTLTDGSTDR